MTQADKLHRKAGLLRRAASHPTEGGGRTDRILIGLAERLEREAYAAVEPAADHAHTERDTDQV